MTASYSIGVRLTQRSAVTGPPFDSTDVTAIVPAFNDQSGLSQTLTSLDQLGLAKIIVVDDGSTESMSAPTSMGTATTIIRRHMNGGAASARNEALATVDTPWIYFTDCGCTHNMDLLHCFQESHSVRTDNPIALVGPVCAQPGGRLADYYTEQGTLNAPYVTSTGGNITVEAIVTSNALVFSGAIDVVGRFDERFPSAGGEDTDLGIRLRTVGEIVWCEDARVMHHFPECIEDFKARMKRYGYGMGLLASKHGFDLKPRPFRSTNPAAQYLADLQFSSMLDGYHKSETVEQTRNEIFQFSKR